jgi:hypothetical protein
MRNASLPVALIVVGVAWLLWYYRLFPDIDWIIALGLAGGGLAILVLDGISKSSVVSGPFMIAAGIAWLVHDRLRTSWLVLLPTLLIVLGALMLLARLPQIPERSARRAAQKSS